MIFLLLLPFAFAQPEGLADGNFACAEAYENRMTVAVSRTGNTKYRLSLSVGGAEPDEFDGTGNVDANGGQIDFSGGYLRVRLVAASDTVIGQFKQGNKIDELTCPEIGPPIKPLEAGLLL